MIFLYISINNFFLLFNIHIKMQALEFYIPLVYQIEGSQLVDALPYLDEYTENDEKIVKQIIDDEMKIFTPKDYISELNVVSRDFSQISSINFMNLTLNHPEAEEEYIQAAENNKILLEYLESKRINLELLAEFSQDCWNKHLQDVQEYEKIIDNDIKKLEKSNIDIHTYRKSSQEQGKIEIGRLDSEWKMLIGKNVMLNKKLKDKQNHLSKLVPSENIKE